MEKSKELNNELSCVDTNTIELANLRKVSHINNHIDVENGDLVYCSANETHVKEISELWANLASIQQVFAPQRYNFKKESKDWQIFVRNKLAKKNNLLLVAHKKNDPEVRGFLYIQTITIPSSDLVLKGVIEDLYTKPQYRKQDIATKLLDVSVEWTSREGIKQLDLVSLLDARDLTHFYLSYIKKSNTDVNLELVTF